MIRMLLNLPWLVLGDLPMAVFWWLVGLVLFISIIGIPWAKSCFTIGTFVLWPFGREVGNRRDLTGVDDIGTGALGLLGNITWFFVAGIWLAIGYFCSALACFVTITGMPFGIQHVKLAMLTLAPIGKVVVVRP